MKFVCLHVWLGEVCTDDTNDTTNATITTTIHDEESMIEKGFLVDQPNEPIKNWKSSNFFN